VESSALSLQGVPSPFFTQRNTLAQPRTFAAGAQVGRFLYVAGGSSGGTVFDTIERAVVLDPEERGAVTDLALEIAEEGGLAPGLYYYRVAPVMAATDAFNPGGENLPSDPFPVRVPNLDEEVGFNVTVFWKAEPGAQRYVVYRSPTAGAQVGTEEVIAEVDGSLRSFKDTGVAPIRTTRPLVVGSLGVWHTLPVTLSAPREGPGVAWAMDPSDATRAYLYVIGGRSDASAVLTSYDAIGLTLGTNGSQTPDTTRVDPGTARLAAGRWQLSANRAANDLNPRIPSGTTFIYALSGVAANGTTLVSNVEAARVKAGGQLESFTSINPGGLLQAGYASMVVGNFVFAFGGANAAPSTTINSAEICGSGSSCATTRNAPEVANFNAAGVSLLTPRYLTSGTASGAFLYVAGGVRALGPPLTVTNSAEYFLW
jgi:hypothetical protein